MKKVFLSGGSRGIGKHINDYFIKKGHEVYSPDRNELDLSDLDGVRKFIDRVEAHDVVINNAGTNAVEDIKDFKEDTFMGMMNVNLISHIMITNHFVKLANEQNRNLSILNMGSIRMYDFKKGRIHYTMSKVCLDIFTKYVIHEYGDSNIICNTISPGYVMTDMLSRNNTKEKLDSMLGSIPLKKFAHPDVIAEAAHFLCIENTYINGENIVIDGGKTWK